MIKSLVQSNLWMEQVIFSVILDKKEIKRKIKRKQFSCDPETERVPAYSMVNGGDILGEEHQIVRLVYEAKKSPEAADSLIGQYMNFIQAETVRFTQGVPSQVREDQLSVAMFAFYEAVQGYERGRGAFLPYAAASIRNRLIDYIRKEGRHQGLVSYDAPA